MILDPTAAVLRRPLSALLILMLAVGMGLIAAHTMPRQEDPEYVRRGSLIVIRLPGAPPERLDAEVIAPIEDELTGLDEIEQLEAASRPGIATIRVVAHEHIPEPQVLWQRVRSKLAAVEPRLPPGASKPLLLDDEWDTLAFVVALTSDTVPLARLDRVGEELGDALRKVPGAGEVERRGDPGEAIEVRLDPNALRFHGLTREGVAAVLHGDDVDQPAGSTEIQGSRLVIRAGREWTRIEEVAATVLRTGEGEVVVRLGDVAEVIRTEQRPPRPGVILHGKRAIVLGVKLEKGVRVDQFSERMNAALAAAPLPPGVETTTLLDQGHFTRQRIEELQRTFLQSMGAVTLITALFLGLLPGLLVASVLPIVSLVVLAAYDSMGFVIEQISVSALVLAMGLLIDNAIVVAEHVSARITAGEAPEDAVRHGVAELRMPLAMSTLTTISAFLPILLMPGGAGEFVRSIGVGVTVALLVSFGLALTYTPAMTLFFHRIAPIQTLQLVTGSGAYRRLLEAIARRPARAAALLLLGFLPLFGTLAGVERDFFPASDRRQLVADVWLEGGTTRRQAFAKARELEATLREHPEVVEASIFVGSSAPRVYYNLLSVQKDTPEYMQVLINLRPEADPARVVAELDTSVPAAYPELEFVVRQFAQGPAFAAAIEVRLIGPDPAQRRLLAERVQKVLQQSGVMRGVRVNMGQDRLEGRLRPDAATLARLGITPGEVAKTLRHRIDGVIAGSLREGDRSLPVLVRGPESGEASPGRVLRTAVAGGTPIASLGTVEVAPGFGGLARRQGLPTLTVEAWPVPGLRPPKALAVVREQIEAIARPPGYDLEYGGEHWARNKSEGRLFGNLYLAAMGILLALFLEFESPRLVALILWTIPLCAAPAFAALWLTGQPLGFMAILGILALTGIVLNDAILLVDGFERERAAGRPRQELVVEVTLGRTNHVLLTSATTVAGFLPLAVWGSEFWAPLATGVIAGLSSITVLTLLLVPALYLVVGPKD